MYAKKEYFVTIGPEGEFEIPLAIQELLDVIEGARFRFRLEGARII